MIDRIGDGEAALWEPGLDPLPSGAVPDVPLYLVSGPPHAESPLPQARPLAARIEALLQPGRDPIVRAFEADRLAALGRVYLSHDDLPRAAALFEAARAVHPASGAATVDLAVVHARSGDVAGALALVEEVLAREPDRLIARLNAGRYRLRLGDFDGAAREFTEARALAPEATSPLVGLSRVAQVRGDRAAALTWLRLAEKISSDDPEVRALHKELDR